MLEPMSKRNRAAVAPLPATRMIGLTETQRAWLMLSVLLLFGFLVRLWAMRWPPFPIDMNDWIAWGERVRELGPRKFYDPNVFADYTPGYVYVLWLTAEVKHWFFADNAVETYYFLYRLPPILCDLATAGLVFWVAESLRRERIGPLEAGTPALTWPLVPALAALAYLLNPAVIINSAVWGQVDSTFSFLMVLSVVLLVRREPEWAVLVYTIAFLIKPQAISLAPVIGLILLMRFPVVRVAQSLAFGALIGFVILIPFFGAWPVDDLYALLQRSTDAYKVTSLFSYNVWGIYGFWKDDLVDGWLGVPLRTLGILAFIVGVAYGVTLLWQALRRHTDERYAAYMFGVFFTYLPVMVLTRMHERYFYPVLPFLLIFALICLLGGARADGRALPLRFAVLPLLLYFVATLLHTINLYQVYTYYRYFSSGGVPATNDLFFMIEGNARAWSVFTILSFTTFVVAMWYWLPGSERGAAVWEQLSARTSTLWRPRAERAETAAITSLSEDAEARGGAG